MSNQREQFSRWTLPKIVHPAKSRRFVICVPDEQFYIAAFRGLLIELTYSKNWQRDNAKTAAIVSRVWQKALESILCDDCEQIGITESDDDMQFRINPDDPCIIQTLCGDGTWLNWYDPRGCIPGSVSQPGGGGVVPEGECREYDIVLQGNGRVLLPVGVASGDTIQITSAVGGWQDGSPDAWRCPSGDEYILGACGGSPYIPGTDPLPGSPHMRLIAKYNGVYVDAYNTTITIPAGVAATDIEFGANDDVIPDNVGSIVFHAKYCRSAVNLWCAKWDATNGWASWISDTTYGCSATLVSGVWHSCHNSFPFEGMALHIDGLVLPSGSVITEVVAVADTTDSNPASNVIQTVDSNGGNFQKNFAGPGTPQTMDFNTVHATGTVNLYATVNGPSGSPTSLYSYKVFGTGPIPTWALPLTC